MQITKCSSAISAPISCDEAETHRSLCVAPGRSLVSENFTNTIRPIGIKAYPVDTGLIALFERSGRAHQGRALETAVLLELERRGYEVSYVRTDQDWEVNFLAHRSGDSPLLLQVCLDTTADETWARELRALQAAAAHRKAGAFLVTLDASPPANALPRGLAWAPAARWLLEEM